MAEFSKDDLARMVEQEARELRFAPVIPIVQEAIMRCHLCGQVRDQLYPLDNPVAEGVQHQIRLACEVCHPRLRQRIWAETKRQEVVAQREEERRRQHEDQDRNSRNPHRNTDQSSNGQT